MANSIPKRYHLCKPARGRRPGEKTYVEQVEMSPELHVAFDKIKAIANAWDGSNPVRYGLPD